MSAKKQPKPFLKKGTRQYLSNATVRSLNQKPKIVDFGDQSNDFDLQKTQQNNTITFGKQQEEEIKIQIKKTNVPKSQQPKISTKVEQSLPKQNKSMNEQKYAKNETFTNKKKPALLQDYIGGASSAKNQNPNKNSFSKEKNVPPSKNGLPLKSMVGTLYRQEEQSNSSADQKEQQQVDIPVKSKQNSLMNTRTNFPPKVVEKKNSIPPKVQPQAAEKICFKEESSDDENDKPKIVKKPQNNLKSKQKPTKYSSNWEDDQEEQKQKEVVPEEQPRGPSKLLQKYYKKQPVLPQKMAERQQPKLQLKDIPRDIQQQIINQYLNEKKSQITKKLDQLNQLTTKARKQRQKLEEQNKQLAKSKEEFYKEMEEKNKEFQEKIKTQNNKLNREKKYMKDQQTSGKADWKQKVQLEELKAKFEQTQAEKKKIKSDLQREIDRLRKKVEQVFQQNENLKQQMKFIQKEKIQTKQKAKQIQKKIQQAKQINYWEGAPTNSYLYSFADNTFTLFDFEPNYYNIETLEHYQYYQSKTKQESQLQREQPQKDGKIVRKYRNGKEEIEYVGKVLKQNFPPPFKFSVLNYPNGDMKLIYPNGIQIYYDSRNHITQFKISNQKTIYNFHKSGQIEMKFRHYQQGDIHEVRKGDRLLRNTKNGEESLRIDSNGMIERLP